MNRFSMSLRRTSSWTWAHALPGLGDATMIRPGYAVEYDFIQPSRLSLDPLETKRARAVSRQPRSMAPQATRKRSRSGCRGINAARNGSERAGGDVRAMRRISGCSSMICARRDASSYRMFHLSGRTSPAPAHRQCRFGSPKNRACGLVDDSRWERFVERRARLVRNNCRSLVPS